MSYLIEQTNGLQARENAARSAPFGPGIEPATVEKVERLDVIGSGVNDPGPDWCEWRAYDATGKMIARVRRNGY